RMFTVPAQGGASVPFQPAYSLLPADGRGAMPVWSPDGNQILFPGARVAEWKSRDWYVGAVSPNAAAPVTTGFARNIGLADVQFPCAWVGDYVYYASGTPAEGINLFRARIAPRTWRISGPAERLTSGPGFQAGVSIARDGLMLFANTNLRLRIWSVPFDANQGTITGERQHLTADL